MSEFASATHRTWRLGFLGVLLLAAALRWFEPELVEFKYDEAHITGLALELAAGGSPPLLSGGTTLGIQRPALDVYLLAGFLKMGGRVEAAVWGVAALGVLAVALTCGLGRRVAGRGPGLLAGLFMAANPWLVFYDRKLWAHIQVVFSVALLWLAWEVVARGRGKAAFWFPVLAGLQGLTHLLALVQGLSWLAGALVMPRRWLRRETGWGLVIAVGSVSPYLWALARRWQDSTRTIPTPPGASAAPSLAGAWQEALHLFAGTGFNRLAALPPSDTLWWRLSEFLAPMILLLIGVGVLRSARWALGGPRRLTARLLLAWTVGPCVVLSLGLLDVAIQYWTVLLPLPALYFGLGLDAAVRAARGWIGRRWTDRIAVPVVIAWTAAVTLTWVGSYGALLAAVEAGAGGSAFGVPLKRWQVALAEARAWAQRLGTEEVRVAVDGVDPGYDGEPAAVAALIGNPPYARFVAPGSPPALLLAYDRPSLYLWAIAAADTEEALLRLGERVWEGTLADGHAPARLYRLPPAHQADLGILPLNPPPTFDVGVALLGYRFPTSARSEVEFEATFVWRVLDPPPSVRSRDFTAFNHVLDAAGERRGQVDGLALLSRDWWPGDVLIQPYTLSLSAGVYHWRVGLYSRSDGGRAQLLSGGDSLDLGPLEVR